MAQDSFVHLAANALLFGGLGLHLERRYGTARIVLLALICGLAGNFLDAAVMVWLSQNRDMHDDISTV